MEQARNHRQRIHRKSARLRRHYIAHRCPNISNGREGKEDEGEFFEGGEQE